MKTRWVIAAGAAGAVMGAVVAGFFGGVLSALAIRADADEARKQEPMESVVAAAAPLAPGHKLRFEDVAVRSVPRRMLTSSFVRPDTAQYVITRELAVPLVTGDLLQWTMILQPPGHVPPEGTRVVKACDDAVNAQRGTFRPRSPGEIRSHFGGQP